MFEAVRRVSVHADQHQSVQLQAQLRGVKQDDMAIDDAFVLQLLDPSGAGRGGEADALSQFCIGQTAVALQFL